MAANIACWCSFSLCCCSLSFWPELFGPSTGEPGKLLDDDGEYDDTPCLPDRSAESAVPPYAGGKLGLLDAEKYNGRRFDASPEFGAVDDGE